MIEVTNLTKKYGNHLAVNNISFTVKKGEILGFLGPNGAGKSTTMNILTGYLSATSGTIKIDGIDLLKNPLEAKKKIGYLPEVPPLYMDMTVNEYLTFVANLKKVDKQTLLPHLEEVLKVTQIDQVATRLIKNLSKGYKQRVGLAGALIGSPEVLILDEPTVGLDPKQIIEIRNLIHDLSKEHTIILSSHILPEISAVCDRVMIMSKGEIVASDTTEHLTHRLAGGAKLAIRLKYASPDFADTLLTVPGIVSVTSKESPESNTMDFIIENTSDSDPREALFNLCAANNYPLLMMKSLDISLEEVFLQVTQSAIRTEEVQ